MRPNAPENAEFSVPLLVVRGAAGVGKSSAIRHVRKRIAGGATLELDDLWAMRAPARWSDPEQQRTAVRQARFLAADLLENGVRPVLLVGSFPRDSLLRLRDGGPGDSAEDGAKLPKFRVISLWARPEVLRARVEGRPIGGFYDVEHALRVNAEIAAGAAGGAALADGVEAVDTSELSAQQVADRILAALRGSPPR
jgi:ribose 1,5-bisphosphokinase PhnN